MLRRDGHNQHDPLTALNLPHAIHAQAMKLLDAITQAHTAGDSLRAADRAEGFGFGLETLRALNPASLEGLYLALKTTMVMRERSVSDCQDVIGGANE